MGLTKEKINECAMGQIIEEVDCQLSMMEDDGSTDEYKNNCMYAWLALAKMQGVINLRNSLLNELDNTEDIENTEEEKLKKC